MKACPERGKMVFSVTFMQSPQTYGELFFMLCDDIQDMDLTTALKSLMTLFVEYLNHYTAENTKQVKSQLINWIGSQPLFIQALFGNPSWES